ncbi:MAG: M15 family metallopeptidase [Bacteroidales bacterium]
MRKYLFTALCWFVAVSCFGQKSAANPYGLPIISDTLTYDSLLVSDSNMRMLDLASCIPGIVLDIRYATTNNFTGRKIYDAPRAFVRLPVARALQQVQEELQRQGLGLKIYDAYRPYAATLLFYETIHDTTYVAAPWKGSRHNRGCAIDLTLINASTGLEIEMPTPFDEFSERAHPKYSDLPKKALLNRGFLIRTMQRYGFTVFPDEWWHFDYQGWEKFPLMDLSFDTLDKRK